METRPSRCQPFAAAIRGVLWTAGISALLLKGASAAPAPEGPEIAPLGHTRATPETFLRRHAPWALSRWSPAEEPGEAARGRLDQPVREAEVEGETRPGPNTVRPWREALRLSPAEALEARVSSGFEPPMTGRELVLASSFAPTGLSALSFSSLPGGIVFGLEIPWSEQAAPAAVRLGTAEPAKSHSQASPAAPTELYITCSDGSQLRVPLPRIEDALATLAQARATPGAEALISITRAGRAQLSQPFARTQAGADLARADLAPFARLGRVLGDKSVVVDSRVRGLLGADGRWWPVADLEVRFYRSSHSGGWFDGSERELSTRAPARAEWLRSLSFEAHLEADRPALGFALQSPDWWAAPPREALEGLERDLLAAAHLAGWTALWRSLDRRQVPGLEAVERELQGWIQAGDAERPPTPPPLR